MADYAIGDVQGCYRSLQCLLEHIQFNERQDRLWFVGDLVNRGPQSLEVLRFVKTLPITPCITLGNHDLHLLHQIFIAKGKKNSDPTLEPILVAADREELGHWLRQQPLLIHDQSLNVVMTHAGIPPVWDLPTAIACARECAAVLSGDQFMQFLAQMYGDEPNHWSPTLKSFDRFRYIINAFTRTRFCDAQGDLVLDYKGNLKEAPTNLYPWFNHPNRLIIETDIVFGHWAALEGETKHPNIYAIDTGCVWGGSLTALRLLDRTSFCVEGQA